MFRNSRAQTSAPAARRRAPLLLVALLCVTPLASADAFDLPACEDFPAPGADWGRAEESGFAFALPPGAQPQPRGPLLDFEFREWHWEDGRRLQFQYGFAVTELADWVDDPDVTGCQAELDGQRAVYLTRSRSGEPHVFAIGLFDYVQGYYSGFAFGEHNPPIANDLVIFGEHDKASIFDTGRALFRSFRWSRLPASALAAWSVKSAPGNGVIVFETEPGEPGLFLATYLDGVPYWLVGSGEQPVVSARQTIEIDGREIVAVSVPLTIHEASGGGFPGMPRDAFLETTPWADAELSISLTDDCRLGYLRWQQRGSENVQTLTLTPTYAPIGACSPYRP